MKIVAFFLCSMVGVAFARGLIRCDYSKCRDSNPFEELGKVRFMPTAQQLREYCPKALTFLDCKIDVIENCTGKTLNLLAASGNATILLETSMLIGVGSLVRDICNPDSKLHKDYVANIECFRGFVINGTRLCDLESKETLKDFLAKSNIKRGGLLNDLNSEINCLEIAYSMTCITIRFGESCGEPARIALVGVVHRLQRLVDRQCAGGPNHLSNQLLEYMEVDDEQKRKMNEILDLFRKR